MADLEVVPIAAAILNLAVTTVRLLQSCYDISHQWKTAPDRLKELYSATARLRAQPKSLKTWLKILAVEKALKNSPESEQEFIASLSVGDKLLKKISKGFPPVPSNANSETKETKKFRSKVNDFFKDPQVRDLEKSIHNVTAQIHQLRAQTTEYVLPQRL